MRRDVSDVDGIYPFHMMEAISVDPLISRTQEKHGHAQMSQYEILSLFDWVCLLRDQETQKLIRECHILCLIDQSRYQG